MEKVLYKLALAKKKIINKRDIIGILTSLLLGRAVLLGAISPFGLAFTASYVSANRSKAFKSVIIAIAAVLGALLADMNIFFIKYMLAFVLFGFIYIAVTSVYENASVLTIAFTAMISILISGIIFLAQRGFVLYDWVMLGFEGALCFVSTLIISSSLPMLFESDNSLIHTDNLVGFYLVGALAVVGFTDLNIAGISIGNALAALFIMMLSLAGGASVGTTGGLCIGLIGSFTSFPIADMISVYGICGLASGIMNKYRRSGVILGFVAANCVMSLYFSGFSGSAFSAFELAIAVALFCLIPKSLIIELETLIINSNANNIEAKNAFALITKKLKTTSESFEKLAKSFAHLTTPQKTENISNIKVVFDGAAEKVCKLCGLKFVCWKKDYAVTYDTLSNLAVKLYDQNRVELCDVNPNFSNKCIKIDEMVKELNKRYSQYKFDKLWQEQLQEGRDLVVNQLYGMSKVLENSASEMDNQLIFDAHLENRLMIELEKAEVKCYDVNIIRNIAGRFEVTLRVKACANKKLCQDVLVPLTSKVLGVRMQPVKESCDVKKAARCSIKLMEQERIGVICAGKKCAKNGENDCGDNYSFEQLENGKYAIIISDGMGTGSIAARQSRTTIELMQQFLNVGFEKQLAVTMVNSALLMKTGTECSATVDAAVFDLFCGSVEFVKIGANTSYIKRGKNVQRITSSSMPVGILKTVDAEITSKNIKSGDYIVMVSDGVHNVCEDWMPTFLSKLPELSSEEASDKILQEALRRKGEKADDDMTVVVAKICDNQRG